MGVGNGVRARPMNASGWQGLPEPGFRRCPPACRSLMLITRAGSIWPRGGRACRPGPGGGHARSARPRQGPDTKARQSRPQASTAWGPLTMPHRSTREAGRSALTGNPVLSQAMVMTEDVARLDIGSALAPPGRCPGCSFGELAAATDGEQTAFMCQSCGQCWQVELGWVHQVDRQSLRRAPAQPHRAASRSRAAAVPAGRQGVRTPARTGKPGDDG